MDGFKALKVEEYFFLASLPLGAFALKFCRSYLMGA